MLSFCSSEQKITIDLSSLTFSFVIFIGLLSPSSEFFVSDVIFFSSPKTFQLLKKWVFSSDENVYLYILFKSIYLYLMKYGYQTAFKFLSDHSNVWVIPELASVN